MSVFPGKLFGEKRALTSNEESLNMQAYPTVSTTEVLSLDKEPIYHDEKLLREQFLFPSGQNKWLKYWTKKLIQRRFSATENGAHAF